MKLRDALAVMLVLVLANVVVAGTGVIIGSEENNFMPAFAMNENAGTLFCAKVDHVWSPGDDYENLRTYISTDGGLSWAETYMLTTGPDLEIVDLDVVAVSGYYYVAYVTEDFPQQAKIRRFMASDGSVDTGFGYKIVIDDAGVEVKEVALTSNADSGNNSRLRYLAIQDNGALRYYWTDHEGGHGATPWTEVPTGVTDADGLLDATYAEGHTGSYLYVVYRGGPVPVVWLSRWTPGDRVLIESHEVIAQSAEIRVSAFGDTVAVLYTYPFEIVTPPELIVMELRARVSYDGGDTWADSTMLSNMLDSEDVNSVDLSLRHGQGIAVTWSEGDSFWMRFREYASSGLWSDRILLRPNTSTTNGLRDAARIEAFPGLGWGLLQNWIVQAPGMGPPVVFDMAPVIFFDGFESGSVSHW